MSLISSSTKVVRADFLEELRPASTKKICELPTSVVKPGREQKAVSRSYEKLLNASYTQKSFKNDLNDSQNNHSQVDKKPSYRVILIDTEPKNEGFEADFRYSFYIEWQVWPLQGEPK